MPLAQTWIAGRYRLLGSCAAIIGFAFIWHNLFLLPTDVDYFLAAGERIVRGGQPYVDVLESNPPLAFLLYVPAAWLAKLAALPPQPVFVAFLCLAIGLSCAVVHAVCTSAGETARDGFAQVLIAAAVLALAANESFGQREHFAAILAVPYVAAAAQRLAGRKPSLPVAILTGIIGGFGMALKPYFLAIPVLVEILLLAMRRDWRGLFRAELMAMAVPVLVYPLFVWWLTPLYFTFILPLSLATYHAYRMPLFIAVLLPQFAVAILTLLFAVYVSRRHDGDRRIFAWLAASLGGVVSYLVQSKGWPYQAYPALCFALIALLQAVFPGQVMRRRAVVAGFAAVSMIAGQATFVSDQGWRIHYFTVVFGPYRPRRVLALTHDIGVAFPYFRSAGIEWGSSYPSLWMLPAVSKGIVPPDKRKEIGLLAAAIVTRDLETFKPDFVLVDKRSETPTLRGHPVAYLELFAASEDFARAWRPYALVRTAGEFEVWRRSE